MKDINSSTVVKILLWIFLAFPLLISIYQGYHAPRSSAYPADFAIFHTAAEMIRSGEAARLYNINEQREFFFRSVGLSFSQFLVWNHPPTEALIYLPLGLVTYNTGLLFMKAFNSFVLCVIIFWSGWRARSKPDALFLLGLTFFFSIRPSSGTIATGQDSLWMLLVFLLALSLLPTRHRFITVMLLALASLKFTIYSPLWFILCLAGFRALMLDALLATILLWLIPIVLFGSTIIVSYARLCFEILSIDGQWGIHSALLWNFRGILIYFFNDPKKAFWLSIPVGLACAILIRHLPARLAIPFALMGATFFSPHIYQHDALMYAGAIILCIFASFERRGDKNNLPEKQPCFA